ncbi:MAG: response regulator, partial [Oscillospiraceae bacterium]|nr:response regulator [Oscillospiraceae bacterium]
TVPIFTVYSAQLPYNAIGGRCPDYQKYGSEIAVMLQKLLDGSTAEEIPVIHNSTDFNRWVFDRNQMDIFNVKPRALPAGAGIINTIPPIWESNPQFVIIMLIVLTVGVLLITGTVIFLLINRKHNKQKDKLRETAQSASRAKSNFLANMSHEMRTPLTAVLGLTELTLETVQLDDETHSNLIKVYRAGETLLSLINDILDISKIEADKLELNPSEYDVPSLLNDTITQSALYLGEKPVELVLNINEDLPNYLYGDELRIKQIFNNLLSNAFKFTKEGTVELGVQCERDGDAVWMTAWVRDTGIGIRPEDMDKLFTLYNKMEEESSQRGANRRTEGTGLGLSISKKVAEMMDGSITAESEYGKGSAFTVKLRQKYVGDAVIGSEVVESLKKFDYSLVKLESAKMTRINLSYARVLIVDDNPTNLDVAKGLMGLYGMRIDCVTGGQRAIDIIRNEKIMYDAIFMDHMMPEMDGVEATRIIREEINTEYAMKIPIIALTANAIMGNEEMFLSKGFQAFISKPIDLARLDAVLRQWVRDKEAEALLPEQIINIEARRGAERRISDIPGLDINKGVSHFGYNEDTYLKVLQSYVKNTQPLLNVLKEVSRDNLSEYAVMVHGIKGSSRGIFAEEAGNEAEALENAAIAGNYNFVSANNQKFIDILHCLLTNIENVLVKNLKEQKPVKDKPDEVILNKLLDACGSFDIDEIDAAMAIIENYDYSSDDGLSVWLRENIDQGKYKDVKEKLSLL